ncbi:TetR/AcrR family transcriptional regulator [Rhizorhabdus dicambivorans]|uniref:TetR/AcrR family transcriptional regulator n=1 Tax=Rhizorhabdus dicambivorans TaxID=1850238 RepID=A0A2A4FTT1_9SPHN|nr:TetR/AcrR family transcriptional regulator [Rhizorhabdus dicambivorans]ATE65813.1 TetR/AcrR family transcriptional regulator [Rhizorhabdus dicambivorans]PCE41104.1 TetR/AcrR family transcriptional regulator [Rhizorhabdus dicambivorans]
MAKRKKPEAGDLARAAILKAAEKHCAERGLRPSSVRAIATAANVNSAMLGYYFGPKETLLREVVSTAAQKICAWRLAALEKSLARHGGLIPTAETIRIYAEPFLLENHPLAKTVKIYLRVVGEAMAEPDEGFSRYMHGEFLDSHLRFCAEIARSTPSIPADRIAYRYHMMVGAMVALCAGREWAGSGPLFSQPVATGGADEALIQFSQEWAQIFALSS